MAPSLVRSHDCGQKDVQEHALRSITGGAISCTLARLRTERRTGTRVTQHHRWRHLLYARTTADRKTYRNTRYAASPVAPSLVRSHDCGQKDVQEHALRSITGGAIYCTLARLRTERRTGTRITQHHRWRHLLYARTTADRKTYRNTRYAASPVAPSLVRSHDCGQKDVQEHALRSITGGAIYCTLARLRTERRTGTRITQHHRWRHLLYARTTADRKTYRNTRYAASPVAPSLVRSHDCGQKDVQEHALRSITGGAISCTLARLRTERRTGTRVTQHHRWRHLLYARTTADRKTYRNTRYAASPVAPSIVRSHDCGQKDVQEHALRSITGGAIYCTLARLRTERRTGTRITQHHRWRHLLYARTTAEKKVYGHAHYASPMHTTAYDTNKTACITLKSGDVSLTCSRCQTTFVKHPHRDVSSSDPTDHRLTGELTLHPASRLHWPVTDHWPGRPHCPDKHTSPRNTNRFDDHVTRATTGLESMYTQIGDWPLTLQTTHLRHAVLPTTYTSDWPLTWATPLPDKHTSPRNTNRFDDHVTRATTGLESMYTQIGDWPLTLQTTHLRHAVLPTTYILSGLNHHHQWLVYSLNTLPHECKCPVG